MADRADVGSGGEVILLVRFDQIVDGQAGTRALNLPHVVDLARSIVALGLLQPLVVDCNLRLLGGAHRLAAIALVRDEPESLVIDDELPDFEQLFPGGQLPVRRMPFDSLEEPERALQVEIAENEKRKDYSAAEVRKIAELLRQRGFVQVSGRPRKGQKALMPALAVAVGKHKRTIQRLLLGEENGKSATDVALSESQVLQRLQKKLPGLQADLEGLQGAEAGEIGKRKRAQVEKALARLVEVLGEF